MGFHLRIFLLTVLQGQLQITGQLIKYNQFITYKYYCTYLIQTSLFMTRFLVLLSLLAAFLTPVHVQPAVDAVVPQTGAGALSSTYSEDRAQAQSLTEFIPTVRNGNAGQIVGVFVNNAFAFKVVQQPASNPGFVSEETDVVTEFSMAANYGTIGLLAHNTAAGKDFSNILDGMKIVLVYGDGTLARFRVSQIRQYQALSPRSPYSNFKDLADPAQTMSVESLFYKIYQSDGNLVLQTCIEKDGEASWGRLFIIAEPITLSLIEFIRPNSHALARAI